LFFSKINKTINEIFDQAVMVAKGSREMPLEGDITVEQWLTSNNYSNEWETFAGVAAVFLGIQAREKLFSDKNFRKLIGLIGKRFADRGSPAEEAFYDLADFVVNSQENGVDHVSATGLWLLYKVKDNAPEVEDVTVAYSLGQLLNKKISL
jgi:hypothetical protein